MDKDFKIIPEKRVKSETGVTTFQDMFPEEYCALCYEERYEILKLLKEVHESKLGSYSEKKLVIRSKFHSNDKVHFCVKKYLEIHFKLVEEMFNK
jgi:hypothetical protein